MKHFFQITLVGLLLAFFLSSCTKPKLTMSDVLQQAKGAYYGTNYTFDGIRYNIDGPETLSVTSFADSGIIIYGRKLYFTGDLMAAKYEFSLVEDSFIIFTTFTNDFKHMEYQYSFTVNSPVIESKFVGNK